MQYSKNIYSFVIIQVLEQVSPKPSDIARTTAATYSDKNRNSDFLPRKWIDFKH